METTSDEILPTKMETTSDDILDNAQTKSVESEENKDTVNTNEDQETKIAESGDAPDFDSKPSETTGDEETIESKQDSNRDEEEGKHLEEVGNKPEEEEEEKKDNETEKDDGWVDILGTGHLKKKVLREGQGMDSRPDRGQLVTVKSVGKLPNGEEVDCHEELTFVLGDGDVIQAWDLAIALMELGEQALVETKPRFAYGEVGRPNDIPANSEIIYDLELIKVEDKPDIAALPLEESCQMADKKRDHGNELYSRKDYSNAINSYSKALDILKQIKLISLGEDSKKSVDELNIKCYNNLAAAQLKVEAPNAALKSCNAVLDLQPKNVKALFRKGKVLATQGEYKEAVTIMKEALALEPANKTIHQELSKLTARQAEMRQSEKELYQRMVGDMAKVLDIPDNPKRSQWMYAITVGVLAVAVLLGAIFASQT